MVRSIHSVNGNYQVLHSSAGQPAKLSTRVLYSHFLRMCFWASF